MYRIWENVLGTSTTASLRTVLIHTQVQYIPNTRRLSKAFILFFVFVINNIMAFHSLYYLLY